MVDLVNCLGVLDLSDPYFEKKNMNLNSFQANTVSVRKLIRSYEMKPGDYLILVNKSATRVRLFAFSGGVGWLLLPEYDNRGSSAMLLKSLKGLKEIVWKEKEAEVIRLKVEKVEKREERRKEKSKKKMRVV